MPKFHLVFLSLGGISTSLVAIVGGTTAFIMVLCVLIIAIPLCICCCLGAVRHKGSYTPNSTVKGLPTTTTTTDVTTDTNNDYTGANAPFPSKPPAVPYPAIRYPHNQENPALYPQQLPRGYLPQQYAGYPSDGYPPEEHAGYPPEGYPPEEHAGYPSEGYPRPPHYPAHYPHEVYPFHQY